MKTRLPSAARSTAAGFTLIELLVVITIIILLAGLAVGVVPQALEKANQVQCLSNARQVNLALRLFADDHDGNFPVNAANGGSDFTPKDASPASSSNDAFKTLFPAYAKQEKLFYVGKSKWCNTSAPDENFTTVEQCLKAGENDYSYVRGLNTTSDPNLPVVFNGLAGDGTSPYYVTDKTKPGGVWGGRKAIVVYVDGHGGVETCTPVAGNATNYAPQRTSTAGGTKKSIFDTDDNWIDGTNFKIIGPLAPTS
ncbi:MAG: type II secretion system protein [Verrucomicrobia bacterium]|nr:type II secretion system protein [Verrucomicrobiota bacterium]